MKKGWEVKTLGEAATFLGGGTPSKERLDYWDGDVPWVSPKDMKQRVITESQDRITGIAIENSATKRIPKGAILVVVRSGILSRTIPTAIAGCDLTINQDLKALVPHKALDRDFLAYFIKASEERLLGLVTRGATVHRLTTDVLKKLTIPVPPLEEQKQIVAILDEAFEGLDRARANVEANLEDAREVFNTSLECELAGISHARETTLGKHVDLLSGFAFKSTGYTTDSSAMRLIRGDNITPYGVRWQDAKYWPLGNCKSYTRYQLRRNDLLIAMDRTWINSGIKFAVLSDEDIPSLLVQRVARLRCLDSLDVRFLTLLIGSRSFEKYVLSMQTGTGVPHVSAKQIKDFVFFLPQTLYRKPLK